MGGRVADAVAGVGHVAGAENGIQLGARKQFMFNHENYSFLTESLSKRE
jgi:hypothetical protein